MYQSHTLKKLAIEAPWSIPWYGKGLYFNVLSKSFTLFIMEGRKVRGGQEVAPYQLEWK